MKLELTTRSYSDKSRQIVIDGLKQIAAGISISANLPPDKAAIVTVYESKPGQYIIYNDETGERVSVLAGVEG